jgi:hypothetical protein
MTYGEIIEMFFNKNTFKDKFGRFEDKNQVFNESNIVKMLTLLFPTSFPIADNSGGTSFGELFKGKNTKSSFFELFNFKKNLKKHRYSYLNQGNKTYTVIRTVWLNDVINNPTYLRLMTAIKDYYMLAQEEKNKNLKIERRKFIEECKKFVHKAQNGKTRLDEIEAKLGDIETSVSASVIVKTTNYVKIIENLKILKKVVSDLNTEIPKFLADSDNDNELKNISLIINNLEPVKKDTSNTLFFGILEYFNIIYLVSNNTKTLLKIKQDFYDEGKIDLDIATHQKVDVINKITKFAPYKNVIDEITKFLPPNLTSKNVSLQDLIENYAQNTDKPNNMIRFVNTLFMKIKDYDMNKIMVNEGKVNPTDMDDSEFNKLVQTSTTFMATYYEIHVLMDVLKGEINDLNKGNYSCLLKGELLGNATEALFNAQTSYDINKYRISSDITEQQKPPQTRRGGKKYKNSKSIRKNIHHYKKRKTQKTKN